jgi:type III pantothenate kinase
LCINEQLRSLLVHRFTFLTYKDLGYVQFSKAKAETIGGDRLANVAAIQNDGGNRIVIDCGTCITSEILNRDNEFLGGFIMPGRSLQRRALNLYTGQLPEVPLSSNPSMIGCDTPRAIQCGVDHLSVLALNAYLHEIEPLHLELKIYLTGGDASYYASQLERTVDIRPNLTLEGLREVFGSK